MPADPADGKKNGQKWNGKCRSLPQARKCGGDRFRPSSPPIWRQLVELGEAVNEALIGAPVTVELQCIARLKKSQWHWTLYAWAPIKTYSVNRRASTASR